MQLLASQSRGLSLQLLLLQKACLQKTHHVGAAPLKGDESHSAASCPTTCPKQPASLPAVFPVQVSAETTDHISQVHLHAFAQGKQRNDTSSFFTETKKQPQKQ